jgi:predicted nucleic acid-binding protein
MKIYLDACCLNRPFDDQSQARIRVESEIIIFILSRIYEKEWEWIGSEILELELEQTPNVEKRERLILSASRSDTSVKIEQIENIRSHELEKFGFHSFDALHIACAESGKADIFLTTDDKLLKLATRCSNKLKVTVANPLTWLLEEQVTWNASIQ